MQTVRQLSFAKARAVWALLLVAALSPAACWGTGIPEDASDTSQLEEALARRHAPEQWLAKRIYASVKVDFVGQGADRAYIFSPGSGSARGLPLVLFHHGWLGTNPKNFGTLIDLLVRRGAVVVYPVYQDVPGTIPQQITENAARAHIAALAWLRQNQPDLADFQRTLYWGFSMGAGISVNLALQSSAWGLPPPRALFLAAPGDARHVASGRESRSILGKLEDLERDIPTVIMTGQADTSIGVPTAREWMRRMCHLPQSHRQLVLLPSDAEGESQVMAGHGSPGAPDSRYDFPDSRGPVPALIPGRDDFEASPSLNQLDFHGYWRATFELLDHVQGGGHPRSLLRKDSAESLFLGFWPSGRRFKSATVEDPCASGPALRR